MPKNNLQILFNRLERSFTETESVFLEAEKARLQLKENYAAIKAAVAEARAELVHYPQAQLQKRLSLIETLLNDLMLGQNTSRRSFNALGFLLGRARLNLASEMLEPRLYGKIRTALESEAQLQELRAKYPDADAVVTAPKPRPEVKPTKNIRLMLLGAAGLNYAIPVKKILKKLPPGPVEEKLIATGLTPFELPASRKAADFPLAVAFIDIAGRRRIVYCDEYFSPVEIPQKLLRQMVTWSQPQGALTSAFRAQVRFYGRRFFVYGARLSYTVRTGDRAHPAQR